MNLERIMIERARANDATAGWNPKKRAYTVVKLPIGGYKVRSEEIGTQVSWTALFVSQEELAKLEKPTTTTDERSDEELARVILNNAGDRPLEISFLRPAALELAKRILPSFSESGFDGTVGNKSQGKAAGRHTKSMKSVDENYGVGNAS